MTREDIVRMAREASCIESAIPDWVIRTCALVASAEREECAKIAETAEPYQSADLIRARGQA